MINRIRVCARTAKTPWGDPIAEHAALVEGALSSGLGVEETLRMVQSESGTRLAENDRVALALLQKLQREVIAGAGHRLKAGSRSIELRYTDSAQFPASSYTRYRDQIRQLKRDAQVVNTAIRKKGGWGTEERKDITSRQSRMESTLRGLAQADIPDLSRLAHEALGKIDIRERLEGVGKLLRWTEGKP